MTVRASSVTHLELLDDHEAQETVESVQAERAQSVLDLGKQSVIGHFLVCLHIIPGVHLIYITCCSKERGRMMKMKIGVYEHSKKEKKNVECILSLLRISDPQDLPAKTANKCSRLVHWLVFGNGDVCRLVDALPVLDLKNQTNVVHS